MGCVDEDPIDNLDKLTKWLETDRITDPELLYWISKYVLMRYDKPFSQLGHMTPRMHTLAESQDKIGWGTSPRDTFQFTFMRYKNST
jgi:hypothetical protein